MNKAVRNFVIIGAVLGAAGIGYYFYQKNKKPKKKQLADTFEEQCKELAKGQTQLSEKDYVGRCVASKLAANIAQMPKIV